MNSHPHLLLGQSALAVLLVLLEAGDNVEDSVAGAAQENVHLEQFLLRS